MEAHEALLLAGWAMIHLVGLSAAWVSRWSLGPRAARLNQMLLVVAFCGIGALATLHLAGGFQLSLLSATTLGVMVIGAVCECRDETEDPTLSRVMAAYE